MISNRPHRPGMLPYKAVEEMINAAGQRKYDPTPIRALLKAVNLFPVGSWVKMADGALAVVVAPNPTEYAKPYVRVMLRGGKRVNEPAIVDVAPEPPARRIESAIEAPKGVFTLEAFCK